MNKPCIALLAAFAASAHAASLRPLPGPDTDALAARVQAQVRTSAATGTQVQFHRRQAFRWQDAEGRSAAIGSVIVQPPAADAVCLLAIDQNGALATWNALAGNDDQPWSCDGEPALTLADVTADGAPDLLVLYPYRPPSNQPFMLPLVLRYSTATHAFELDPDRTRWLRTPDHLPTTLKDMKAQLRRYREAR